jgi:hypothetical protein
MPRTAVRWVFYRVLKAAFPSTYTALVSRGIGGMSLYE